MIPEIYFSNALLCGHVLQATEGFLECISVRVSLSCPSLQQTIKEVHVGEEIMSKNRARKFLFWEQPTCSQCASHDVVVVVAVAAKKFDGEVSFLAEFALPPPSTFQSRREQVVHHLARNVGTASRL